MNTNKFLKRQISLQFLIVATIVSLLLSAFPAAFFVAEAATDLYTDPSATVETTVPYASGAINAVNFSNLSVSFSSDSTKLDGSGDSFSYGWRAVGGSNVELATVTGLVGETLAEVQTLGPVSLPIEAQISNLEIYIEVVANPGGNSDQVLITDLKVSGDPIQEVCTSQTNVVGPTDIKVVETGEYFNSIEDASADCDTPAGYTIEQPKKISVPVPADATIIATKIVCDDEMLLPNDGYTTVTNTTAADFLASTPERTAGCHLQADWSFEWALNSQDVQVDNAGAQGAPWTSSDLTNTLGVVTMVIPGSELNVNKTVSVREVMKANYLPFTGRTNVSNITAELYCTGDAKNYDNLEWIPGVSAGGTYHCVAWNVQLPPPTADVTMCKTDDKGAPLPNWQLSLLGTKVADILVNPTGATFTLPAVAVGNYAVKASGTYVYRNPSLLADATFSNRLPADSGYSTLTYLPWKNSTEYAPNNYLGLQVNGTLPWGSVFNPAHVYYSTLSQTAVSDIDFKITDTFYGDNVGAILAELYKGYTGVTGKDGCVVFTDVPYGTYTAEELLQTNWQPVSGLGDVVVDVPIMTHTVVNKDISRIPVATIVAEKVVCTTESALPNWNKNPGGAPKIVAATAADWVEQSDGACRLVPDWQFEWALPQVSNPGDTLVGQGGTGWTTFGPTDATGETEVTLTAEQIAKKPYVWIREVLKDGYLGFSHAAKPNNSNDVTAEMYCHTDGVNYDNYDRVDGIQVDTTYHCVAFNYELPKPVEQCELTMYSDEETVVVERNGYAVPTYNQNNAWSASIPGATWIWDSYKATEIKNSESETFTFNESFTVYNPTFANLDIAADNDYEFSVNGVVKVPFSGSSHFSSLSKDEIDILPFLSNGYNEITIKVKNFGATGSNYAKNPAGLLYKLVVKGDKEEVCEITTAPVAPASLTITNPVLDGDVVPRVTDFDFKATYSDDDDQVDTIQWAIRASTCEAGVGTIAGNVDGFTNASTFVGSQFSAILDTISWAAGDYCFVINPIEQSGEADLRATRLFTIAPTEPTEIDLCPNTEVMDIVIPVGYEKVGDSDECTSIPTITTPDKTNLRTSSNSGTKTKKFAPASLRSVLGASTSKLQCGMYLKAYTKMGATNDTWEVKKLQWFLNGQGLFIPVTGTFDAATDQAVRDFQLKYQSEILTPWFTAGIVPHQNPTGWMYQLTRWKINNIVCPGSEAFPVLD